MGHNRPLLLYFRIFKTVDSKQMFNKILPMTGFERWISGVGSDRSTNWTRIIFVDVIKVRNI